MAVVRIDTSLVLIAIWAVLLVIFLVLDLPPRSVTFWTVIGAAILIGVMYMVLTHRDTRRSQRETAEWGRRLNELVDINDFDDDGHLAEFLDNSERQRVIEALEQMPKGSRSLRQALHSVSPDLVPNDA